MHLDLTIISETEPLEPEIRCQSRMANNPKAVQCVKSRYHKGMCVGGVVMFAPDIGLSWYKNVYKDR